MLLNKYTPRAQQGILLQSNINDSGTLRKLSYNNELVHTYATCY